jgi:hypothetical protein
MRSPVFMEEPAMLISLRHTFAQASARAGFQVRGLVMLEAMPLGQGSSGRS